MTTNNETQRVLEESAPMAERAAQEPGILEIARLMELAESVPACSGPPGFHEDAACELIATTHTNTLQRI